MRIAYGEEKDVLYAPTKPYYRRLTFKGAVGDRVRVHVSSPDGNPAVSVTDGSWNSLAHNEDVSASDPSAAVELTLTKAATYSIIVYGDGKNAAHMHVALAKLGGAPSGGNLTSQGFVFERTDRFEYEVVGPSTASGLECVGGPNGKICYSVYRDGARTKVKGSADRYQHSDGRIAYLTPDQKTVGPVRPGTYTGTTTQRFRNGSIWYTESVPLALRVKDLTLGTKGEFPVATEYTMNVYQNLYGGNYFSQPEGGASAVSLSSEPGGRVFGYASLDAKGPRERLELNADGKVARYDYAVSYDPYSLAPTFVSFYSLSRATQACATPYRCIQSIYRNANRGYTDKVELETFSTQALCSDGCKVDPYAFQASSKTCIPAIAVCHP